ncbi:hypothetical protein Tco_0563024 [Tanacetum coccineum]
MMSRENSHLVDLLAKEKEVADVARMTNHTHQDLNLAVGNHQILVDSLAEKLRVARAQENRYTNPSSSSQPKPTSIQGTKKKRGNKKR